MKPVLFVTGHVPAYRVGALARLHERERIEVALFGGRSLHGGAPADGELPFPHRRASRRARLAPPGRERRATARWSARPAGGSRLPATWAGARAGRRAADPVGVAVGAPAQRRARAQLPAAAAALPLGRRGRHLRPARERLRARRAARATCTSRRSRSTTSSGARPAWRPPRDAALAAAARARGSCSSAAPAPEKGLDVLLAAWRDALAERRRPLCRRGLAEALAGAQRRPAALATGRRVARRARARASARRLRGLRRARRALDRRRAPSASRGGWSSTRR